MKRYYLGIVFLIVLFAIPFSAKAECSYSDKVRLQKLAGNVNFGYRYKETQYTITFDVTVSNLTNSIYMVEYSSGKRYYANNQDFTISGYQPGRTIRFDFYAKDSSCIEGIIFTNYVTLPSYNPYYNSDVCKGIEDFKLCQKWLKHNMTYQEFYTGVMNYKNSQAEKPKEEEKNKNSFDWEVIVKFWSKYYIFILLGIIVTCGIVIYQYDKKSNL